MKDIENYICNACNGSGEGLHDGTTCSTCKGRGEVYDLEAEEYARDMRNEARLEAYLERKAFGED